MALSRYLLGEENGPDGNPLPMPASLSRIIASGGPEAHKSRLESLQRRKMALQAHLSNDDMFDQLNFDAQRFKSEAVTFEKARESSPAPLWVGGAAARARRRLGTFM